MTGSSLVIADDSPLMRTVMENLLGPRYTILASVEDGRAAVEACSQLQPGIVLLDISMPILNGFEAARQIRQLSPAIRLIFVSEHHDPNYMEAAFEAGGSAYVLKSKMHSDLILAIEEVLREASPGAVKNR